MRRFLLVMAGLSVVTLYVLAVATGNTNALSEYFWWAFAFGSLLLAALAVMAGSYWWRLLQSRRRREFGSRIAVRLAAMFTLVAVLPGVFLFGVSAQFISHSIHSWFGNDTAEALERSLNLSKSALDYALENSTRQATAAMIQMVANDAVTQPKAVFQHPDNSMRRFSQLVLVDVRNGRQTAAYNPRHLPAPNLLPEQKKQLNQSGSIREIESIDNLLYAQGWLLLPGSNDTVALFFRQPIPEKVARDATLIEAARAKYAELSYAKQGLQTFFLATLLMATLLAIVLALLVALYFARRFVAPILLLAEGARAVAKGDLRHHSFEYRSDELGQLMQLFSHMTTQLRISSEQQTAARHYLECILNSLTTGVVTFDHQGCLKTHNQMAEVILGQDLSRFAGMDFRHLSDHSPQTEMVAEVFKTILATAYQTKPAQLTYNNKDEAQILLGKATPLPKDSGSGTVVVFDDVTALVQAQKEAAWGEVAQRLAHEIRNPLTPIQLSAERLAWKLSDKLDEHDANILQRATDTIIRQVAAMKDMVEAFRNYAKAPALNFIRLDFNELIREILILYEGSNCTFVIKLSNMPLFIRADSGALRQVVHNMLKNAVEAASSDESPTVTVHTHITNGQACFQVENNGKGFSKNMLLHAFDPYVTDKAGGTGLGLPVVKKIIEEHGGRVQIGNRDGGGAFVRTSLPLPDEQIDTARTEGVSDAQQ